MGEPLDGERLLAYVRVRLEELDEAQEQLPAVWEQEVDRQSVPYKLGRMTGLASAYHDIEHAMRGWYGDKWENESANE